MNVAIVKRSSGGFTMTVNGSEETMFNSAEYYANNLGGVGLYLPAGVKLLNTVFPEYWTIDGVTGFLSILDVCNALDTIGISAVPTSSTVIMATEIEIKNDSGNPVPTKMVGATGNVAVISLSGGLSVLDPVLADGTQKTRLIAPDGTTAVISPANTARANTNPVLLVQTLDANGNVGTGGSATDDAAFDDGADKGSVIMGVTGAANVISGHQGALAMTLARELKIMNNPHSYLPATHWSPADGALTYLGVNSLTCTGFPFTVDAACAIRSLGVTSASNVLTMYENGVDNISIYAEANVIYILKYGASFTAFLNTDLSYKAAISYQEKTYDPSSDANKTAEISPLSAQYVVNPISETVNVATGTYLPSATGMSQDGYKDFSITGQLIDAHTTTITWEGSNEPLGATSAMFVPFYAYDTKNNIMVNNISVTNGTLYFAVDFDNLNYAFIRFLITTTSADNTIYIYARQKAL